MSTKPDSGTGEQPTVDSPPPEAEAAESNGERSSADTGEPEVEVAVEGSAVDADVADDDSDIAIEVEAPEPEPDPAAEVRAELAELQKQHLELQEKHKDTYERLLRATADLDNFRKRSRRDLENARTEARSKTLIEMLPVVDNLERAVAHAGSSDDAKGIADGVNLVLRQFGQALERCGVVPVEAIGTPFDPNIHEAVSQQETSEHPPGTVVAELQKGYVIGERLLRPTLAVVSTAPAASDGDESPRSNGHDTSADAVTAEASDDQPAAEEEAPAADAPADDESETEDGAKD